jgi:hypothetical protein
MSALTHEDVACRCSKGWVRVDDDYVTKQAAKMRRDDGSLAAGVLNALRDSVRPCHTCQPGLYESWRQGQLVGQGVKRTGGRRRSRGRKPVANREEPF